MLKHKNIIDKLTKEQKIALLTDSGDITGDIVKELKLPQTNLNDLWQENLTEDGELLFPSPKSLAHSWSGELFGQAAYRLASIGSTYGDNLFALPSTNSAGSLYGKELAEEPYLSGSLVRGACHELSEKGVKFCIKAPMYEAEDVRFLDDEADKSVLYDRVSRPFKMVADENTATAVLLEESNLEEAYRLPSCELLNEALPHDTQRIIKIKDSDLTTSSLTSGMHVIGGSSLVISTALENYKRIYRSMEEGGATAQELQMTLADGAAISESTIDEALDRKIELAAQCSVPFTPATREDIEAVAYEAFAGSVVMLKNANKTLPIKRKEKIALVGDIVAEGENRMFKSFVEKAKDVIEGYKSTFLGFESGYALDQNVSHDMIEPALDLAKKASTVVAFVGLGSVREGKLTETAHLSLPGNQIALLTRLRRVAKRLVVVVCGEKLPDMGFDSLADAIFLMPNQGSFGAKAIIDIITGRYNPRGRLAYAGYHNVDKSFRQIQKRKRTGEQKIGPYIGYRYADANGEASRYPLGFGLSYTTYTYSGLSIDARRGKISFTVKNSGHMAGYDVPQLYIGKGVSYRIRPVKELKFAESIYLKPGRKCKITIDIPDLEIYDTVSGELVTEDGEYSVYLGSSSSSIWLEAKLNRSGTKLTGQENKLSDYLHNVSNIITEGYTMEAYCKPMNKKSKLKTFGAILFITTLFLDLVYAISCLMLEIDFMWYLTLFAIINGVCLGLGIIFMIIGNSRLKKAIKAQEKAEAEATKELFKAVELANVSEISELFEDEFDVLLEDSSAGAEDDKVKDEATYAYMSVDTDIPTLAKDLEEHFKDCGVKITSKMARRILSGIMTSRLLIIRNTVGIEHETIVEILARFFGTTPHTENINGTKWDRESLLRQKFDGSSAKGAPLLQAFNSALNEEGEACFYGLANIQLQDAGDMLMPFVQYFGNPDGEYTVADVNGTLTVPSNLWFVVSPTRHETLEDLPAFVANLATVIDLEGDKCSANFNKTNRKAINCNQMDALVFRAKKACEISEEFWKSIDSLESFVNEKTPYHIGNKLFLQLERYMAIYTACEDDMHQALDSVVASQLLPAIANLLKGNEAMKDVELAQIIESILGEDYCTVSRTLAKRLALSGVKKDSKPTEVIKPKGAKVDEIKSGSAKVEEVKPTTAPAAPKTEPAATPKTEPAAAPKAEPVAPPVADDGDDGEATIVVDGGDEE